MGYFKHEQALVDESAMIGEGTRIWAFANIQKDAVIGKGCNICDGSFVETGAVIGDYVTVKHHVEVFDGVMLEDNVFVGSNVAFINDRYPRSEPAREWELERTLVKKGASIGSNSTVLCGITVGEYAVVGAGSVVTKDVPAHAIVFGNPAVARGFACSCGKKVGQDLACACGKTYTAKDEGLVLNA